MNLKRKIKYFLENVLVRKKRLFNLLLNRISKLIKLSKPFGYPLTLMVEPTNICNLKCPLCPTGAGLVKRQKGFLQFRDFKKIIDEAGDYIFHLRLWNWGESLMNKEVFEMISYAKKKNIFINLSTNSNFLTKEIASRLINSELDELIISLDGASEETYKKYRVGGNFKKVIESIKFFVSEKKRLGKKFPHLRLQFIIMKHNEHEIQKIKSLAKEMGVDEIVFKTVGIMDYSSKEDIKKYLPTNKNYSRYALQGEKVITKIKVKNKCDSLWDEMVINWDGTSVPCCFDMNNSYVFSNVFEEGIKKTWNNSKYVQFRKKLLKNKKSILLCKNCPGTNKETFVKV